MRLNRRQFVQTGVAAAALCAEGAASRSAEAQAAPAALSNPAETAALAAINPPSDVRVAGIRMIPVVGGKYKVWTKRVGSGPTKVLLLHGGPALTHNYLEAMESFLPQAGIEMYYYDQLGCGNSDIPDDPSLWTIERFTEEVEEVRRGLGLDQFVLLGHSWGGMLGIDYALKYQQHLKALVISNMAAGMQAYVKHMDELKNLLSAADHAQLDQLEAAKDYDNPEYHRIVFDQLYTQMICRLKPWPEPLTRSVRFWNEKVYNVMQGKSEFSTTGNLKTWERWDRLHEIKVRTLTIGAKYDEMDPQDMQKMATMMPNATNFICPNGSHLCFWDDQQTYFNGLLPFLKSV